MVHISKTMQIPKSLQPHYQYTNDVFDEHGRLTFQVHGELEDPRTKELRDELIRRWNAYESLKEMLESLPRESLTKGVYR